MKKPDIKAGKYYLGHIFLDRKYLADIDKFIDYQQSQLEEREEEIKTLKAQLSDDGDLPQIEIKPISSTKYKYQLKTK